MGHPRLFVSATVLAASFGVGAVGAHAEQTVGPPPQQPDSTHLPEVVVTAQRSVENVQNVPVAVQVVTARQTDIAHVTGLIDLQKVAPSLVVQDAASNVNPYIRGVGSTTQGAGYYASVATYIDGVYVTRLSSGVFDLDDIEGIQVLEGPQGTLYGRNATGGAIVITTQTPHPGDPMRGDLSVTYGSYDERKVDGRISGGLTDQLGVALSGSWDDRDGFIKNLNPPGAGADHEALNSRDYYALRGAVDYRPLPNLDIVLRGSIYHENDRNALGLQAVGLNDDVDNATLTSLGLPANPSVPLNGTAAYYAGLLSAFGMPGAAAEAAAGKLVFSNPFGATYDNEANGFQSALGTREKPGEINVETIDTASARINYVAPFATITSTTSYTQSESETATEVITADPSSYPAGFNAGSVGFSGDFPAHNLQEDLQIASKPSSPIK